jgi:hypothetical protein
MAKAPWTEKDLDDLRDLVRDRGNNGEVDWEAVFDRFPHRTKASICKQMHLHGMTYSILWTPEEDDILRKSWNEVGNRVLAKRLAGRTLCGIYERAQKLGLRAGTPQGMVSVSSLANDPGWGYDYYKTIKILQAANIVTHRFSYTSGKKQSRGTLYVEEVDAREAAEEWERSIATQRVGKETPKEAAKRLGVRPNVLTGWLTEDGLMGPLRDGVKRRFWAEPKVYDAVVAKYRRPPRSRPEGLECPVDAAKRLGMSYYVLRRWLWEDDVTGKRPKGKRGVMFLAPPEVFDRVCAKRSHPPDED